MEFLDVNLGVYTEVGGVANPITSAVTNQEYEIEIPTIGKINLKGLSIEKTKSKIEKHVKEFIL